jgi:hypothetical protein
MGGGGSMKMGVITLKHQTVQQLLSTRGAGQPVVCMCGRECALCVCVVCERERHCECVDERERGVYGKGSQMQLTVEYVVSSTPWSYLCC